MSESKDKIDKLDPDTASDGLNSAQEGITKGASTVAFFTMISRIAGLIRDTVLFHIFGATGITDAFFIAFTIPNVLRRFVAEGALTVAFVPVYTDIKEKRGREEGRRFFGKNFRTGIGLCQFACAFGYYFCAGFCLRFRERFCGE